MNLDQIVGKTIKSVEPRRSDLILHFEDGTSACIGVIHSYYKEEMGIIENYAKSYDGSFGDNRVCQCGHAYYRHFDTYADMDPVGCKYCRCYDFKELEIPSELESAIKLLVLQNKQEEAEKLIQDKLSNFGPVEAFHLWLYFGGKSNERGT